MSTWGTTAWSVITASSPTTPPSPGTSGSATGPTWVGYCGVPQYRSIGSLAMVGGMSLVLKDVPDCVSVSGNPASAITINAEGMRRAGIGEERIRTLRSAWRIAPLSPAGGRGPGADRRARGSGRTGGRLRGIGPGRAPRRRPAASFRTRCRSLSRRASVCSRGSPPETGSAPP
ncbi:MAG: hypothetical protein U5R48_12865 [Gammaproteobacteria bacterium]|nr:hypothetical protein [Gammaproteobacteria bacterium]